MIDNISLLHPQKSQYTPILQNLQMTSDLNILLSSRKAKLSFQEPKLKKILPKQKILRIRTESNITKEPLQDLKIMVFPDILKKTHTNIRSYRTYDIKRIDDDKIENYLSYENSKKQLKKKPKSMNVYKPEKLFQPYLEHKDNNPTLIDIILPCYQVLDKINSSPSPSSFVDQSSQRKFHNLSKLKSSDDMSKMKSVEQRRQFDMSPQDSYLNCLDNGLWKVKKHVNKVNKAYLIQQQYFKDKIDQIWNTDTIQKQLQKTIIQNGNNVKTGLRQLFLILFTHDVQIQHTSQREIMMPGAQKKNFKVIEYFIPVYKKIHDQQEVLDDMHTWIRYLLEMLKIKQQNIRFFYLDGKPMKEISNIPSFEKVLYVTLVGQFDFWQVLKKELFLNGEFNMKRYPRLVMRIYDLQTKEDFKKYFLKRDNLTCFFETNKNNQFEIQSINMEKIMHPTTPNNEPELNEMLYENSVFRMNESTQRAYLQAVQDSLNKQKAKYSTKIDNVEDNLRSRISKIKSQRLQPVSPMRRGIKKHKSGLSDDEEEAYENLIMNEEVNSIEDIKEYAQDKVHPHSIIVEKKHQSKQIWIDDPFQLLSNANNKKFANIIKYVNIEKIMCEKFLSRQDVITYLSLFKSLMDSDKLLQMNTPSQLASIYYPASKITNVSLEDDTENKKSTAPKLYISLKQLRRAMPYLALYKQTINTKKLNDIFNTKFKCVGFMDFLDIFSLTQEDLAENEVLDNQAFM